MGSSNVVSNSKEDLIVKIKYARFVMGVFTAFSGFILLVAIVALSFIGELEEITLIILIISGLLTAFNVMCLYFGKRSYIGYIVAAIPFGLFTLSLVGITIYFFLFEVGNTGDGIGSLLGLNAGFIAALVGLARGAAAAKKMAELYPDYFVIPEPTVPEDANGSCFTGGILGLIGIHILQVLITVFTLGIGYPWAVCQKERWMVRHTVIDGHRLSFDGTGAQLFGNYIKWMLLTVITFGIYGFWLPIKMKQWVTKHTHML